jgi:hypothetical protein
MKQDKLPGAIDYSIERYANGVINGRPQDFDAIEVQGVRSEQTGADSFVYEVDNVTPEAFSTYLHSPMGGVQACGDFTFREDAQMYARELANLHGWPIHDFTQDPAPADPITK